MSTRSNPTEPALPPSLVEQDEASEQRHQDNRADGVMTDDERAEANYPVARGATRWVESASASGVYDTPWGRRELLHEEAAAHTADGRTCTLVDGDAETSLEKEKADMAHVPLTNPTPPAKRK